MRMKLCPKCGKQFSDDANFCPVDAGRLIEQPGGASDAAGEAESSNLLDGRFRRAERIGGGLTGDVFNATDEQTGQACVVKVVDPSVFPTALLMQRTERELKQLERVNSSAIAKVLGHGKHGNSFWIASERVVGATPLDDIVVANGPLNPVRASKLLVAIGQALGEAARVGVIHRDLAPKNVLVGPGDSIKLINFGVPVPATEKVQGVPEYVAPELIEGRPVDQRSNIYSLGAIYYLLLTGQPPYMGDPDAVYQAHLRGELVPPSGHVALPASFDSVVLKALERSSSKRFMTLRQLIGEVETLAAGDLGPATTQPMGRVAGKKSKQLARTMVGGFKSLNEDADPAEDHTKTEQRDVAVPLEARRPDLTPQPVALPAVANPPEIVADQAPSAYVNPAGPTLPGASSPSAGNGAGSAQVYSAPTALEGHRPSINPAAQVSNSAASAEPVQRFAAPANVAAAQPAAPASANSGAGTSRGKSRRKPKRKSQKGKFRETMWFKKGALDEAAAEAAEAERERAGGKDNPNVSDKADSLPMDQRYEDDGTITAGDKEKFSLKTGHTSMMAAINDADAKRIHGDVSEDDLIGEMKGGRGKIVILILLGLALLIGIVMYAVSHSGGGDDEGDKKGESKKGGVDDKAPAPAPAPK